MTTRTAVLTWACLVFAAVAWGEPKVKVEYKATQIVASDITPGGDAVFFGVARERLELGLQVMRWSRLAADSDRDGQVVLDLGRNVPAASVWAVLDLATGRYTVASPVDVPYEASTSLPEDAMRRDTSGLVTELQLAAETLDLLVVRPGVGAWRRGANDLRPRYTSAGLLTVPVERLQRLGAAPEGPGPLALGDLVIGIDPLYLRVFVERVGAR